MKRWPLRVFAALRAAASKITGETLPPRRTSPAGPKLVERGVVISTRPRRKPADAGDGAAKPTKVGSISTP